jgi:hypothetical protein
MSVVTEISFLCNNPILQTTTNAQVGRRASGFVQVGLRPRITPFPSIRPASALSIPESYAIGFHDPKLTCRRSVSQDQSDPMHESENGVFVLPFRPKNNDPGVLCRRVCPDVGEIQVQCDQDSAFGSTPHRNRRILRSRQAFIGNRIGLEPSTA